MCINLLSLRVFPCLIVYGIIRCRFAVEYSYARTKHKHIWQNFGSDISFVSISWGNISLDVFSMHFNKTNGFYEVKTRLPAGVRHTSQPITLDVNGQFSARHDANAESDTFYVRHGHPMITNVDLGKNMRMLGATLYLYTDLTLEFTKKWWRYL